MESALTTSPAVATGRTLVLADWKTDPHGVVAVCIARPEAHEASVDLVVPAALHGIDWVGDPFANAACARRALDELTELLGWQRLQRGECGMTQRRSRGSEPLTA